jgi:hypothetical protein
MHCPECQAEISEDIHFCEHCGAVITPSENPAISPDTSELMQGQDGVWRWTYALSLLSNPTVFITVTKVILLASLVPVLLTGAITLFESGLLESLRVMGSVLAIVLGILLALMILAYLLIALLFRGKYCVVFEMDDHSVTHLQMQKQFQKNQVLAYLTVLAGAAAGNPQTAGAGLLAGSKRSSTSTFSKVKSLVFHPSRHVIYVNEAFNKNQVYAPPAFYEAIQNHLIARCPKAKVVQR